MSQFTADPDGKSYGCQLCTAAGRSGIRIEVFHDFVFFPNSDNDSDLKGCFLGQGFEEFEGTLSAQVGLCFKAFFPGDNFFICSNIMK